MSTPCGCIHWLVRCPSDLGIHHHLLCPFYRTEKHLHVFYFEPVAGAFVPYFSGMAVALGNTLAEGEEINLRLKGVSLTDEQYNNLAKCNFNIDA